MASSAESPPLCCSYALRESANLELAPRQRPRTGMAVIGWHWRKPRPLSPSITHREYAADSPGCRSGRLLARASHRLSLACLSTSRTIRFFLDLGESGGDWRLLCSWRAIAAITAFCLGIDIPPGLSRPTSPLRRNQERRALWSPAGRSRFVFAPRSGCGQVAPVIGPANRALLFSRTCAI